MANELANKKIAILVTKGFEEEELTRPRRALHDAGATTHVVSPETGKIRAWDHTDWVGEYSVDIAVADANPDEYDGLLLPGGVMNPDNMRRDPDVQRFVRAFFDARKPVAVICHAPWTLIDAGVVKGRKLTSYPTLQMDLKNAGAEWVDEEVVVDNGLVSSRRPDDIPAFNAKMIEEFAEGPH
ncbi:MAG: type 1 glutamine amidotransferase [Chloroflexi bacterium]|nr:type 1 glutamine amidotransferase [Chloroflexota bacterium]